MTLPRALLVSLRPHQWTKNLVVLAALAFSKHLFDRDAVLQAGLAFVIFCALSGAVYLVNDLRDLESDRLHPRKRLRPLASGDLPVSVARGAAVEVTPSRFQSNGASSATLFGGYVCLVRARRVRSLWGTAFT